MQLILIIIAVLTWLYWCTRKPPKFPPGPPRLPLIGNVYALLSWKHKIHEMAHQLSVKYGPLVGMYLGGNKAVIVNGFETIKMVSQREDCIDRPDGLQFRQRSFNKRLGLLFIEGHAWKEQRRFTLRHLRDFGFGKRSMEHLIHEEIGTLMANIDSRRETCSDLAGVGMPLHDLFPVSVINILWAIMAGVRYKHDDKYFQTLMKSVDDFFRYGSPIGGVTIFPLLRFVPVINKSYKKQLDSNHALQDFVKKAIDAHKESYQENDMRDFIDVFLRELNSKKDQQDNTFIEEQLIVLCMDLFIAGTETTSNTLAFALLYLALHPTEQRKASDEIRSVVGSSRLPSIEDAAKCHYVQATIQEVLRICTLITFTPPHKTSKNVNILGYNIPKGTSLLINLYSVFMDQDHWGDPEVFRPERFLNKDGEFVKDDFLIVFGAGPRICLGEPLARNTTFLFLSALLQQYHFSLPSDLPPPNMDHLQGITGSPRPFTLNVTKD